jgi:hypothetical protein
MKRYLVAVWSFFAALSLTVPSGCAGTTDRSRFGFEARAGGAATGLSPTDFTFTNERGWAITLHKANVTLGPVYLNTVAPLVDGPVGLLGHFVRSARADGGDHLGGGRIVGEVLSQITFNALSSELVPFPGLGTTTDEPVRTTDVWLYPAPGVSADTTKIDTVALDVAGIARRDGRELRFRGSLVLNDAWLPDATAGQRGTTSIALLRRVRGIPSGFTPANGGSLEVRFDVRAPFRGADFSNLEASPVDREGIKLLVQSKSGKNTTDQVMTNLFQGVRATTGTYAVRWVSPSAN